MIYHYERSHMSLDTDIEEIPAMAFERKMPSPGSDVTDEEVPEPAENLPSGEALRTTVRKAG